MRTILLVAMTLAVGGCSQQAAEGPVHRVRGKLMAVAADRSAITVDHDEIPGLMPAMTMEFRLASADLVDGVTPGAEVEMALETGAEWKVSFLRVLSRGPAPPTPDPRAEVEPPPRETLPGEPYFQLGVGQRLPDFRLIDQDGQVVSSAELRGKAIVMTFVYTRCPMPDFCPLITRRMLELQRSMPADLATRTHILMVSIDPQFDTSEVLDRYARQHGLDRTHASLLTGPIREVALLSSYFGLEFWNQKDGSVNHKLRVAVIDPQGRLHAELQGNTWTTQRLLELLRQSFAERSSSGAG